MAYTPLSVLILLGCLAAILGQAVKDSGKEGKPCSEAGLRVKGRNQEAGNWTVRLGDLQAVVQHQDRGGDGEGEWEAALYQKVSDCGEETDQEAPGDDNQDNDDNEIDIDGGVSVTGASVSTTPEITTPQTTKPGTTSPVTNRTIILGVAAEMGPLDIGMILAVAAEMGPVEIGMILAVGAARGPLEAGTTLTTLTTIASTTRI